MRRFRDHRMTGLILAAAMLLTSVPADVYASMDMPVSEELSVSVNETAVSGNETPAAAETEKASALKILDPVIMYGEDGSNRTGNLDRLFKPRYVVGDSEIEPGSVEYKFFTDLSATDKLNAGNFADYEGVSLEKIEAGTDFAVAVLASGEGLDPALAVRVLTMAKRPLIISVEKSRDIEVSEKDMPEDEKVTVSANTAAFENVTVTPLEDEENTGEGSGFVYGEDESLLPENAIDGDVQLDVSGIDGDKVGYQEVPVIAQLSENLVDNYEIAGGITPDGYIYVEESKYYITFAVKSLGKTYEKTFVNDKTDSSTGFAAWSEGKYLYLPTTYGMSYENWGQITGWKWIMDAVNIYDVTTDFIADPDGLNYALPILPKKDYYFVAETRRKAIDMIYVDAIPDVVYDGRAHVTSEQTLKSKDLKKKVNDLELTVYCSNDGGWEDVYKLRYGKDYKVAYKNNTAASLTMTSQGQYMDTITDPSKKPQVVITGIGTYKGFSTTVYFDIMPYNLAKTPTYGAASVSGLKHLYALNGGSVGGKDSVSVSIKFPNASKAYKLKEGVDYKPEIYKYVSGKWVLKGEYNGKVSAVSEAGRYLYALKGTGNYCGQYFGSSITTDDFVDNVNVTGTLNPAVCSYTDGAYSPCQFKVDDSTIYDLSDATVTVKKTKVNYEKGRDYTADDFGIKVYIGKGKDKIQLLEGTDYKVVFDGVDYYYVEGRYKDSAVYKSSYSDAVYDSKIQIANKYKVRIEALATSPHKVFGSRTAGKQVQIKGIRINPGWYKLSGKKLPYDGSWGAINSYRYDPRRSVREVNVKDYLYLDTSKTYYDEAGKEYYKYNYSYSPETSLDKNLVVVMSEYDKLPGTYYNSVYPFGPGVDHSYAAKVKFMRKAGNMKDALKMTKATKYKVLEVSASEAKQNAGGAIPKYVTVKYTSFKIDGKAYYKLNNLEMKYNGQAFTIYDCENYPTTIRLYASGNTKPGQGTLSIQGDGVFFKGKAEACKFSISSVEVPATIPVLDSSSFMHKYGKYTNSVGAKEDVTPVGTVFAVMGTEKKSSKVPAKPKITLYQSYYSSAEEVADVRASLKKIDPGKYKFSLTPDATGYGYSVKVENAKSAALTGYDFATNSSTLNKHYTVYDKAAAITDVEVRYNGETYYLGRKGVKLSIPYSGKQINGDEIQVISVGIKGSGERLYPAVNPFRAQFGDNATAGKNKGSITIILQRDDPGAYQLGGSKTFKFDITDASPKSL